MKSWLLTFHHISSFFITARSQHAARSPLVLAARCGRSLWPLGGRSVHDTLSCGRRCARVQNSLVVGMCALNNNNTKLQRDATTTNHYHITHTPQPQRRNKSLHQKATLSQYIKPQT